MWRESVLVNCFAYCLFGWVAIWVVLRSLENAQRLSKRGVGKTSPRDPQWKGVFDPLLGKVCPSPQASA